MKTDLKQYPVADVVEGFEYNELEGRGLFGLNGRLTIQPEYQRNYIYGDGKRDVVAGPFWYAGPDFKTRHTFSEPVAQELEKTPTNSMFTFIADGITYKAYAMNAVVSGANGQFAVSGTISDLIDLNNAVFSNNLLMTGTEFCIRICGTALSRKQSKSLHENRACHCWSRCNGI